MKIGNHSLVTGGAGFIGSHLVEKLLDNGHQVIVIDNYSNGRPENLAHIKDNKNLVIHNQDISDIDKIEPLFEKIDNVFHLAALADIVPSIENPLKYHKANVDGTIAVLEASRKAKIKRFLYAVHHPVMEFPDTYPTPETAPVKPMYPYALTKNIGEQYVMHWNQLYNLPAISLRLFNVFGPRARTSGTYGAVFGVFLAQKLAGKPFTIVGDGKQTRDFTYVTDVADAFLKAAESDVSGEIFNVGSGGTYSVNELVDHLGGEKTYIPKRPGEPDCTFADITKIQKKLGWKPEVSFTEGVQHMLSHIGDWKNAPLWDEQSISNATKGWFNYLGNTKK